MAFETGCVSIAATGVKGTVTIDRVIEYFYSTEDSCCVWIDVFFTSKSDAAGDMLILHRGSFSARNATCESWVPSESTSDDSFPQALTRRICELHRPYLPIEVSSDGIVSLGGIPYTVWNEGERHKLSTVVGDDNSRNVPFTMWSVGPISSGRVVFRIGMKMSPATFAAGIGRDRRFFAYGESILLKKIRREDIPSYNGPDAASYVKALAQFERSDHITPDTFEYLVVAPEGVELPWNTAALSPRLLQPSIRSRTLEQCTRWFVADTSTTHDWHLTGKAYTSFVVKVDMQDPLPARIEPAVI